MCSPTVIKRVFAPSARGDKAALVEASEVRIRPAPLAGAPVCRGAQAAAALGCRVVFQIHGSRSATLLAG